MNTKYLSNAYQFNNSLINLDLLPPIIQQELMDYYSFLINKYGAKNKDNSQKEQFFKSVKQHRFKLPKDYKFDRDAANER